MLVVDVTDIEGRQGSEGVRGIGEVIQYDPPRCGRDRYGGYRGRVTWKTQLMGFHGHGNVRPNIAEGYQVGEHPNNRPNVMSAYDDEV